MTVPRRRFGRADVHVSAIAYGTMSLEPSRFSDDEIVRLFVAALDAGITTFHVSNEYESYPGVRRALRRAKRERPQTGIEIVAKIAEPHFDADALANVWTELGRG